MKESWDRLALDITAIKAVPLSVDQIERLIYILDTLPIEKYCAVDSRIRAKLESAMEE